MPTTPAMRTQDFEGKVHDDWHVYDKAYVVACGVPDARTRSRRRRSWARPAPRICGDGRSSPSVVALRSLRRGRRARSGVVSNTTGQIGSVLRRFGVVPGRRGRRRAGRDHHQLDDRRRRQARPCASSRSPSTCSTRSPSTSPASATRTRTTSSVRVRRACAPFLLDPYDDHAGADYERIKAVTPTSCLSVRAGGDAITLSARISSAPSKIDSTRASTNRRLTGYSSA